MSFQMMLVMAFTVLGVALVVLRWFMLRGLHIHYEAFNTQIIKLIIADNVDRALKLCGAVPRCSYALALRAALSAGRERKSSYGPEIQAAAQGAFQREMTVQLSSLTAPALLGGLGLALLVCGLGYALAYRLAVPNFVYAGQGAGILAYLISLRITRGVKRSQDLFPEVAVALASALEQRQEQEQRDERLRPPERKAPTPAPVVEEEQGDFPRVAPDSDYMGDGLQNPDPLPCPRCGSLDVVCAAEVASIQGMTGRASVQALVCRGCGYTELHTPDADQLSADDAGITEQAGFPKKG